MINWGNQCILVSGASGFIGTAICTKLSELGCSNVNGIYRATMTAPKMIKLNVRITWHEYDGSLDSIKSIFSKCTPTLVLHLAAKTVVQHKAEDIDELFDAGMRLPGFLADCSSRLEQCSFINTGSFWTHYMTTDYKPVNLYAATKQAFEDVLEYFFDATNLKGTTLVLPDTYGPGDGRAKLIPFLFKKLHSEEPISLSPGQQKIDLLHKDDVASAYVIAAELLLSGMKMERKYRLTSGSLISIQDLVNEIEIVSGKRLDAKWGALAYRARELMYPCGTEPLLPTWRATISLHEGLKEMMSDSSTARFLS